MLARANTGTVVGVEAHPVIVEAHWAKGLPQVSLIGLARGAMRESTWRVKSAVTASGKKVPGHNVLVSLLPAELPKEASALDLAVAVAFLASTEQTPAEGLAGRWFYGELSLGGGLEAVRGAVLVAELARRSGAAEIILPAANATEAATIGGIRVLGARNLGEVIAHLEGTTPLCEAAASAPAARPRVPCLSEVRGQTRAKRALEVAAAGGHNLLMIGPPGSGKTMLARRLPGLLPQLDPEEGFEVTRIYSAAGLLAGREALMQWRPFRAPHHTASDVALCGGGSHPRPGEITLAHRGVLFLDELPEFSRRALESLREPLEEGSIHIARAALSLRFPADVLLAAAMNPCPCGNFRARPSPGDAGPTCLCSLDQIQRYRSRISGPLLDRIELHVAIEPVPYRDYARGPGGESTRVVRERVLRARAVQARRLGPGRTNASMSEQELREHVPLDEQRMGVVQAALDVHGLSTRAVNRILKVARTLADLDGHQAPAAGHLAEAIGFRLLDRAGLPVLDECAA